MSVYLPPAGRPEPREARIDPYTPSEMAGRAISSGVSKVSLGTLSLFVLSVLAGAFISLGAELATIAGTDSGLGYGPTRILVGLCFSLGLVLVVVAGAELFTGNNLIVMAWANGKVSTMAVLRNGLIVYAGNAVGALGTVLFVYIGKVWSFDGFKVGATALNIANSKVNLSFEQAVALGILCNALVCLAVWLCYSARSTTDKILAVIPPITAFVASGFEHSVANMYFIPLGILLRDRPEIVDLAQKSSATPLDLSNLSWGGFLLNNLLPVTIGNIIGGALLVGGVYWLVYLRPSREEPSNKGLGAKEATVPERQSAANSRSGQESSTGRRNTAHLPSKSRPEQ